ncbi:putative methyltransferase small domain-containing protein [Botrytis fragariae]|uniref:Putative methyltransferase small domain-containing protein n=1 Tax=Botrytis fragariae TaxID=1964551 RepID=A0A8H6EMA2_9HELO|nr:putative methyltransferase small domain-containing protein [Botrytis fragariae]KAF5877364.1 putative methyltransferase small domain-containing protein [Botrytis fragariae]
MPTPNPSTTHQESVSTYLLYNRWAATYDTDHNPLQILDSALIPSLLKTLFFIPSEARGNITITELGCGTGRNTIRFLAPPLSKKISKIHALDLSPAMLEIARSRCSLCVSENDSHVPSIQFDEFNALNVQSDPEISSLIQGQANMVISTLVLEHLPLDTFFSAVAFLLKPDSDVNNGRVLITNMHAEMGRLSQAGFSDEIEGKKTKVRGESYVYEIEEVVEEGKKWGFHVVGEVLERTVEITDIEEDGSGLKLGSRGEKWIGKKMWFGMVMQRKHQNNSAPENKVLLT